jgi:poly(A) polymerase
VDQTPDNSSRPQCRREDAVAVVQQLRAAGHIAYFAGGCVRDLLLDLQPKDYDVATDAPPQRVREIFKNTQAVGAAFGVILVRLNKSQIEVATFRRDLEYEDGRHPVGVKFTSAEEDAKRRDFTINGLFLDPVENRVIDFVGGQEDLKTQIVRAIGDPEERFREDHLRVLRAVRFAARLEFNIEAKTADAIRKHAPHLTRISPERIAEELRLMLTRFDAGWAWFAMVDEFPGISDVIFRFSGPAPTSEQREHLPGMLSYGPDESWDFALSLAAAALDWSIMQNRGTVTDVRRLLETANIQRMIRALRQSLRISNEEVDMMRGTLEGVAVLLMERPSVATLKRLLQCSTASLSRRLLQQLPCLVGQTLISKLNETLDAMARTDFAPPPFITGEDLIAAGLKPGKLFKQILNTVYDAQLEDRVTSKPDAMKLAMEQIKPAG